MLKRKKRRRPLLADCSGDPDAHLLTLLKDQTIGLKRLYSMARDCLRRKVNIRESLAIMERVITSRETTSNQKDRALRLLAKHRGSGSHATYKDMVKQGISLYPEGRRADLFADCVGDTDASDHKCNIAGRHRFIPDAAWNALSGGGRSDVRRKRWYAGHAAENGGMNGVEGSEGDDDE